MLGHGVVLVPGLLILDVGPSGIESGNVLDGWWVELDDVDVILIHPERRARGTNCDLRNGRTGRID